MRKIEYKTVVRFDGEHLYKKCVTKCKRFTWIKVGSYYCNTCEYKVPDPLIHQVVYCSAPIRADELHKGVRV